MKLETDTRWMNHALHLARRAELENEVPVGAVLVKDDVLVAEGWNQTVSTHDPTAHAEIIALRAGAIKLQNYRLLNTTLYVTLEPCIMCAGAIINARVKRVVYGADDPKAGAAGSVFDTLISDRLNHRVKVESGVLTLECSDILTAFFLKKR